MFAASEIVWSKEQYSLMDLNHNQMKYPALVKIVQGFYDKTPETTYDPEQTFVFHGWGAQERVVAENKEKTLISIPIYHEHKLTIFHGKNDKRTLATLPLSSIVRLHKPPVSAKFDPSVMSVFYIDDVLHNSQNFGQMTLKSGHYLQYAKCSPVIRGRVNTQFLQVLPVSLDVVCAVATKIRNKADGFLDNVLKDIAKKTAYLGAQPVDSKLVGITGYNDLLPAKEEYEYIEYVPPGAWGLKLGRTAGKITNFPDTEASTFSNSDPSEQPFNVLVPTNPPHNSEYETPIRRDDQQPGNETPTQHGDKTPEASLTIWTVKAQSNTVAVGRQQNLVSELESRFMALASQRTVQDSDEPVIHARGATSPLTDSMEQQSSLDRSPKADHNQPEWIKKRRGLNPLIIPGGATAPPEEQAVSPKSPLSPRRQIRDKEFFNKKFMKGPQESHEKKIPPKTPPWEPTRRPAPAPLPKPNPPGESTSAHGHTIVEAAEGRPLRLTSLEDIPKDISTLTVTDVGDCLRLLNLEEYADTFMEQQVDGRLLQGLSAKDLQQGFGLNPISARKLDMFARQGWIPTYSSHNTFKNKLADQ